MKNVAVFGATSAIAEHVARRYASQGDRLFLVARDPQRLQAIRQDLMARGAGEVWNYCLDLTCIEQFGTLLDECMARLGTVDIALIAFGTLGDQPTSAADPLTAKRELITNFVSPACLAGELAQRMQPQRRGVIGVISSVAGDRGRQSNYVYGSAKGGLSIFLDGLRHRLATSSIKIVTIKPGFVDTPMTAGLQKSGPLWARPERVSEDICAALESGRPIVYTPWFWKLIMTIIRLIPRPIFHKLKI